MSVFRKLRGGVRGEMPDEISMGEAARKLNLICVQLQLRFFRLAFG